MDYTTGAGNIILLNKYFLDNKNTNIQSWHYSLLVIIYWGGAFERGDTVVQIFRLSENDLFFKTSVVSLKPDELP